MDFFHWPVPGYVSHSQRRATSADSPALAQRLTTPSASASIIDATQVTIGGNSLFINPTLDLTGGASYDVQFVARVITDIAGVHPAGLFLGPRIPS
ncbi:MAG: hypothetical protein ACKVIH_00705 [Burkholderiales bacterium]